LAQKQEEVVVFSGNLEYHPNVSAVRFFRLQIWPQLRDLWPGLIWRLIGKNPEAVERWTAGDPRIQVTGPVEDAVAEIARGRVAVVPLLSGSGTRFKILEAWAAGVPVVSTTLGAEGLGVSHGEHLLLADDVPAMVRAIDQVLKSPAVGERLAHAGRSLLEKEFTWDAAWKSFEC
jgi:glycosyltransferase involved in cell wall biosynthesis